MFASWILQSADFEWIDGDPHGGGVTDVPF